jgi:hypothetical protein
MRRMKRSNSRGQAFIEFLFILLWTVPFLLITVALGINLISGLEVIQLARDAASMYARNVDFSDPSSTAILDQIGNGLHLTSSSASTTGAVAVMSALTFMDANACTAALAAGCGCGNSGQWVFTQYQVFPPGGRTDIATRSKYGDASTLTDAKGNVNYTGHQCNAANSPLARAVGFSALGLTPWTAGAGFGVPSGLNVYLVEVTAKGYPVPGYINGPVKLYNYAVF